MKIASTALPWEHADRLSKTATSQGWSQRLGRSHDRRFDGTNGERDSAVSIGSVLRLPLQHETRVIKQSCTLAVELLTVLLFTYLDIVMNDLIQSWAAYSHHTAGASSITYIEQFAVKAYQDSVFLQLHVQISWVDGGSLIYLHNKERSNVLEDLSRTTFWKDALR